MANKGLGRAVQRVQREIKEIMKEEFSKSGITVEAVEDNFMDLKGKIVGPPDTPYEGGIYILDIKVPKEYPFKPVKVQFVTKIWHPNINSVTGTVCLNILNSDWVACISLRTVLLSIQALLSAAEPDSPINAASAKQYEENNELFQLTAKYWAQIYAGAPGSNSEFERKIKSLTDRGIDENKAVRALSSSFWDVERALDSVFRYTNFVYDGF